MTHQLLCVQAHDTFELSADDGLTGVWQLRVARDAATARRIAAEERFDIGMVVFDRPQRWSLADVTAMTRCGPRLWIAAIAPAVLADPETRRAVDAGFRQRVTLPVDMQRLRTLIDAALAGNGNGEAEGDAGGIAGMVGRSAVMLKLYRQIEKIARFDAPVLLSGESGTGKEVTARAIHHLSQRSGGPLVAVDCGSLPVNLVHSELFGHEKGSFTGAHQRKIGSIQAADGGVVFLDEIGDLPLELQSSLLRFLQEKTIVRVGATQPIRVDCRVVAASHVNLWQAVRDGRFREDLYYRLNVLHLHLPPLRERGGDVALLAQAYFAQRSAQKSPQVTGFSPQALAAMEAYAWPGNVRELINRVQKAMIMCDRSLISPADLGLVDREGPWAGASSLRRVRGELEREAIHQALVMNSRNVAAAARQLGVSRTTFYRLVQKFGIQVRPAELGPADWRRRQQLPS